MRLFTCASLLLCSITLCAESDLSFDFRKNIRHVEPMADGFLWESGLRVPFSFAHSDSRLGVDNGNYIDLAAKLKSSLHYRRQLHDWSTSLFVAERFSMTPKIKNYFLKSQDVFRIETRYLYNWLTWLSPYAHARMETSIMKSTDVDSRENDYELQNADGTVDRTFKATEVHMADPFRPLFFVENIGLAAALFQEHYFYWEARTGVSARQTIADGQQTYLEERNNVRILRKLASFHQFGPFLGTALGGSVYEDKIEYAAGAETLWPALQWPTPQSRSFWQSLILEASAGVLFKVTTWSSLSYEYSLARIPDLHPKFQQSHTLNLNISFDWLYAFGAPEQVTPNT